MGITAVDCAAAHRPRPTGDAGTTNAAQSIGETKDHGVIAVRAAGATFDPGISSYRKIDIERACAAVDFSGYNGVQLHWRRRVMFYKRLVGTIGVGEVADGPAL